LLAPPMYLSLTQSGSYVREGADKGKTFGKRGGRLRPSTKICPPWKRDGRRKTLGSREKRYIAKNGPKKKCLSAKTGDGWKKKGWKQEGTGSRDGRVKQSGARRGRFLVVTSKSEWGKKCPLAPPCNGYSYGIQCNRGQAMGSF